MKIFGKRIRWKKVLTVGVSLLLVAAAIGGVVALFGKDTTTVSPSEFKRGSIGVDGKSVSSETSIYTKEAFPCQGLRIVPDFEATGTFDVYYYDVNDRLLSSVKGKSEVYEGEYPGATFARVVYNPAVPEGEDKKEWKIGLLEVLKYAKQLTITVNKEQVQYKASMDLYVAHEVTGTFSKENINEILPEKNMQSSAIVAVDEKYDYYTIYVKYTSKEATAYDTSVMFGDADYKAIRVKEDSNNVDEGVAYTFDGDTMIEGSWYSVMVEVPEGATSLRVCGPAEAEYRIYGVTK